MDINKLKPKELREKSSDELTQLLKDLLREHFNLRMQQGMGSEIKPHLFHLVKKNIARVKTILGEK